MIIFHCFDFFLLPMVSEAGGPCLFSLSLLHCMVLYSVKHTETLVLAGSV